MEDASKVDDPNSLCFVETIHMKLGKAVYTDNEFYHT